MSWYSDAILADTPSQYLRYGESSGASCADSSGNGRSGTTTGTVTRNVASLLAADAADKAISMAAGGNYVTTAYNPFTTATDRTFEGIMQRTSKTNGAFFSPVSNWFDGANLQFANAAPNDDVVLYMGGTLNCTWTAPTPGLGTPFHWAIVIKQASNAAELFIDGVSKGSLSMANDFATTAGRVIGWAGGAGANSINGINDEHAAYEYALSAGQIKHHSDVAKGLIVARKRLWTPSRGRAAITRGATW